MAVGTVVKKSLRMTFANTLGASVSLTVPNPVFGLTALTIKAFMNLVILKNLFTSVGGNLIAIKDIVIVDTTTEDLFDVPIA